MAFYQTVLAYGVEAKLPDMFKEDSDLMDSLEDNFNVNLFRNADQVFVTGSNFYEISSAGVSTTEIDLNYLQEDMADLEEFLEMYFGCTDKPSLMLFSYELDIF